MGHEFSELETNSLATLPGTALLLGEKDAEVEADETGGKGIPCSVASAREEGDPLHVNQSTSHGSLLVPLAEVQIHQRPVLCS